MKQKELAEEFGVTALYIGRLRKKHCDESHFDEKTGILTSEGVEILRTVLRGNDPTDPRYIDVRVINEKSPPGFLTCRVVGENYGKIRVIVPRKHRITVGNVFRARLITYQGEPQFRHECFDTEEQRSNTWQD